MQVAQGSVAGAASSLALERGAPAGSPLGCKTHVAFPIMVGLFPAPPKGPWSENNFSTLSGRVTIAQQFTAGMESEGNLVRVADG